MATSTEALDFWEMMAVENLIGQAAPVETFEELSLDDQDLKVAGKIVQEPMDIEMVSAHQRVPATFGIPTLVEVASSAKWLATNEDFISLQGYASDEESEFAEDISVAESQSSMSSEESVLTEELESMDIVEIVSPELTMIESGGSWLDDSLSVPKHRRSPSSWNYTQHLESLKLPTFSESAELLEVDRMNAKLENLTSSLEREQELRAKLLGRRRTTPPAPPPRTQTTTTLPKRPLPSYSTEPRFKRIETFYETCYH